MPMPEFLRSCMIDSGGGPECLNFDVRLPYYYKALWMTKIPVRVGSHQVLDPNRGRFRGQSGIGYGDS
ncbi:unnamed protein product [Prunus brigantina]